MLCSRPFRQGVDEFDCGRCMPCRIKKRRLWAARLMLESRLHKSSIFATLTYNKDNLPSDGNVSVREAQLFIKRLRKQSEGNRLRYFIVGEYGDESWRPHYHAVLFGLRSPDAVKAAWPYGFVHCGSVTHESAGYVAGYAVKRFTVAGDERLGGRAPEFARMSLRPGIGAGAMKFVAKSVVDEDGVIRYVDDVPKVVRMFGRKLPLGRYLRRQIRVALGRSAETPEACREARSVELQSKLSEDGAYAAREAERVQHGYIAEGRNRLVLSKKGIRL